jgi:hypothetical protein
MYLENKSCPKHRHFLAIKPKSATCNNLSMSEMTSRSAASSYDPYDLTSYDEYY